MKNVLHWRDAVAHFGPELQAHAPALKEASRVTHAVLACRTALDGYSHVINCDGEHAERRLVLSDAWAKQLDRALSTWDPRGTPLLALVVLNRSPCGSCAQALANALHVFNDRYCLTVPRQHFVCAALGYYHSNKEIAKDDAGAAQTVTTLRGLRSMKEAGWKLCALDFGGGLTRRGKEWHGYLSALV